MDVVEFLFDFYCEVKGMCVCVFVKRGHMHTKKYARCMNMELLFLCVRV